MNNIVCTSCNENIQVNLEKVQGNLFCPYCGNIVDLDLNNKSCSLEREIQLKIDDIMDKRDPVIIFNELSSLETEHPNSLAVQKALLLQGNLHLRSSKKLNYFVIHCYLLNLFLEPDIFNKNKRQEIIEELTNSPRLQKCISLSSNPNNFLREYYIEISERFIELFLLGSSKYMRTFFGITQTKKASKYLAYPTRKIINNIFESKDIDLSYKKVLMKAFYIAFGNKLENDYSYLNEELNTDTLTILRDDFPMVF
ncbi:MAG: hypothetical protein GYA87_04810 [Christensenellaceae bacterium]|nr:hypothetical protein [Christensenellaceae bacterium]